MIYIVLYLSIYLSIYISIYLSIYEYPWYPTQSCALVGTVRLLKKNVIFLIIFIYFFVLSFLFLFYYFLRFILLQFFISLFILRVVKVFLLPRYFSWFEYKTSFSCLLTHFSTQFRTFRVLCPFDLSRSFCPSIVVLILYIFRCLCSSIVLSLFFYRFVSVLLYSFVYVLLSFCLCPSTVLFTSFYRFVYVLLLFCQCP